MLLAIDVGNTNIVFGVFSGTTLVRSWRLQTVRERTLDEVGLLVDGLFEHDGIKHADITGIVLGSVVPPVTGTMRGMIARYFGLTPLIVDPATNAGMPIRYENPAEVGADRIVHAIAAYEQFGRSDKIPLIVCDFCTPTPRDPVTAQ